MARPPDTVAAVKPELVWQESSVMRARDLQAPDSITGGPNATGPSHGVTGPHGDLAILGATCVLAGIAGLFMLSQFSVPGFLICALIGGVAGYMATVRYQQARHPAVLAGPGGVWLAGTDREVGRAIPWGDIDELVFCTITERRVFHQGTGTRFKPHSALGVRLKAAPTVSADEQERLERVLGGVPDVHQAVLASMTALLAMPYRRVASSVTRDLPGLVAAVRQYAPSVRIVEGPPLTYALVWRPGADSTPPGLLGQVFPAPQDRPNDDRVL